MADARIPDIGKYRIIELVGEGAMGVVYRAVDTVLNRTVAIKVMNDAIARQEELRTRFLREAQAAASLQHPNVVCVYDLGEVDGHLFIAMEFVQGVDLEHLISIGEPISLQTKIDIVVDVLTGLSFAHKRGIVHRDIKPANIRVGEDGRAKIMDFGVAHLASSNLTSTGASLGTPGYMAPEQITGGQSTAATDIFAVGGVLYELLTGVRAFDGASLQNLFYKIIMEEATPVSELKPGLPPVLYTIVDKAMAKDPADRFPSAAEMADALSGVRAKLSGPAYPETLSLRHSVEMAIQQKTKADTARRSRKMAIGGGALAAAALLALVWSQIGSPRPPGEPASVPAPATAVAPAPVVARTDTTTSTSSGSSDLRGAAKAGSRAAPQTAAATPAVQRPAPPAPRTRVPAPEVRPSPAESRAVTPRTVAPAAIPSTSVVTLPPVPQPAVRTELATPRPAPIGPVQAATERAPPPAAAPAAATTAADLAPIFESYARAIESRDVGSIRRVYPGLTPEQERGFEQFFRSARDINVTFRASNVEIDGATAEARLTGHYQYVAANGKSERQPVSFMANLRREGGDWRMVSVR